ncbi:MAG: MMPL family transporter [Clostridia bacterium]
MLGKFASGVVALRKFILIFLLIAVCASAFGIAFLLKDGKANSNMLDFLGEGTSTREGLNFLEQEFAINGDAMFAVQTFEDDEGLYSVLDAFALREGVSRLIWYGTLEKVERELDAYQPILEFAGLAKEDFIDVSELSAFLKQPALDTDGKYNFVVLMMLEYPPSSNEAFAILDEIASELSPRPVAFAGMTDTAKTVMHDTLEELPRYLFFGVLAVLFILILTTTSYIEPFIVLVTLGTAIVVNLGTGYLFPGLSVVGYAASAVLQLGCTLDFAVIFIHLYKQKRQTLQPLDAVKSAAPRGFSWIIISALVTMGGLSGLGFIGLDLGKDLAFSLIKGIFTSMITVVVALPALLFVCDKLMVKTAHRRIININYEGAGKVISRQRALVVALTLSVFLAALVAQSQTSLTFFKIYNEKDSVSSLDETAALLANQMIIAVPLIPEQGTQAEFIAEMQEIPNVDKVLGVFSAIKIPAETVEYLFENTNILNAPELAVFFAKTGEGANYTLCSVILKGNAEDKGALASYEEMRTVADKYFGGFYGFGVVTGVADMSESVAADFWLVTFASSIIVFFMLLVLLKSVRKAAFLITLIELGIWANLAINAMLNIPLNFLIYIMIPAVQMSCTINYALFVCLKYDDYKKTTPDSAKAAALTIKESAAPVLTGMSLLIATCLAVYFASANLIIKDMSLLLARGGLIGGILALTVVPALLTYYRQSRYPRFIKKIFKL